MSERPASAFRSSLLVLGLGITLALPASTPPQSPSLDARLIERIDAFVAREVADSGIPGVAIAVLQEGHTPHVRGFGHDGRSHPITADTPFPIGSLTKSFTALLIRQQIESGQLELDSPVQRYVPWFRVADSDASARVTLRHLLNHTSGFSRADGITPLLQPSGASSLELARGMKHLTLNRPIGKQFEYSNLNYLLLGAILETATNQSWDSLVRTQILTPLGMSHTHTTLEAARRDGMTRLHHILFGLPVARRTELPPGLAATGGLAASATDMARYLDMLLAGGQAPADRILSPQGVEQLLTPGSPRARSRLLSTDFEFQYGEGWFVGPFGAAADARWHLGNLATFAAWMVLLPHSKQAAVVLINANSELPFDDANAVMSRLPIGIVNLMTGESAPHGPGLRSAYRVFNIASTLAIALSMALTGWATRPRRRRAPLVLAAIVSAAILCGYLAGISVPMLAASAPDLVLVLAVIIVLLYLPLIVRAGRWLQHTSRRSKP